MTDSDSDYTVIQLHVYSYTLYYTLVASSYTTMQATEVFIAWRAAHRVFVSLHLTVHMYALRSRANSLVLTHV